MNLKKKLILSFMLVGLVPLLASFVYMSFESRGALQASEEQKLLAVNSMKANEVQQLFMEFKKDAFYLASADWVQKLSVDLEAAANKVADKRNLFSDSSYKKIYDSYYPTIHQFVKSNSLYDFFIISPKGLVYYTDAKESDFGSDLSQESTDLAKAWAFVIKNKDWYLTDTQPYAPSKDAPAQFLAVPMIVDDALVAVIAFQVPLEPINKIMVSRQGMGKSGESYLVGNDLSLRSDTFIHPDEYSVASTVGKGKKVRSANIEMALSGGNGVGISKDYLNNEVLSSFQSVELYPGLKWALLSEVDTSEALASVHRLTHVIITFGGIVSILLAFFGFIMSNQIANPVQEVCETVALIAKDVRMASVQLSGVASDLSSSASEQAAAIEETSASLEELTGILSQNSGAAKKSSQLALEVNNVSMMGHQSMTGLKNSMDSILESNKQIVSIESVIQNIGEKTEVMDEIVFKTKLLSFNAAVEAERAGEAGRGFSVVAQEVSHLAEMSGKSAEEIAGIVQNSLKGTQQITRMNKQSVEQGSEFVHKTAQILERILEHSQELNKEAEHVDRSSQEQLKGVEQINLAIQNIDQAMQKNSAVAEEAAASSEELSQQVEKLNDAALKLSKIVRG